MENGNMKKTHFNTIEDLLASESFMCWYHGSHDEDIRIWNEWITASNENRQLANKAINFMKCIKVKEKHIAKEQIDEQLNQILDLIKKNPCPTSNTSNNGAHV
jgi:thymidylate synthase